MGIVQRQGFLFTVISYAGAVVGAINTLFLYPALMKTSEIGILGAIISLSVIYAQISQLGVPTIISRFFPEFRTDNKSHQGFMTWVLIISSIGFLISTSLFLIFRLPVSDFYAKSPEFVRYIYLVVPLAGFTLIYAILDTISRAIYKSLLSSFLNSFFLKLTTSAGVLAYYFNIINFEGFLFLYVSMNGFVCLIILLQLIYSKEFSWTFKITIPGKRNSELLKYGLYTLLGGSTYVFLQKMDSQILLHYTSTSVVGAYTIYLSIVSFILIPSQAINRVAYQLVADSWVSKDMKTIADIYRKTSIVQMIFGCLLFIGIVLNKENLLHILRKQEYRNQFPAFYMLALATLVDLTGGLNTYIITVSHKFRVSTFIVVLSMLLCVLFNFIFVPGIGAPSDFYFVKPMGAFGAGLSLFLAYTFMNFSNWLYLKIRFNLQPFNRKHLILLIISICTYIGFSYLPVMSSLILDLIVRSLLIAIVFGSAVIVFEISADVNRVFNTMLAKFKNVSTDSRS